MNTIDFVLMLALIVAVSSVIVRAFRKKIGLGDALVLVAIGLLLILRRLA